MRPGTEVPTPAQIAAEHVAKIYRMGEMTVPTLDDVSVEIAAGEMVCVLGRSGSGKSTLLRQPGLIDTPSADRLRVAAQDVTGLGESKRAHLRLARLGYVFIKSVVNGAVGAALGWVLFRFVVVPLTVI